MCLLLYVSPRRVNCRIGSLESEEVEKLPIRIVNCRIGSLEIAFLEARHNLLVNCRIGSLEMAQAAQLA